jgi:hypothetical protein
MITRDLGETCVVLVVVADDCLALSKFGNEKERVTDASWTVSVEQCVDTHGIADAMCSLPVLDAQEEPHHPSADGANLWCLSMRKK